MSANTPEPQSRRIPAGRRASAVDEAEPIVREPFAQAVRRRARDILIMGVVGPATGVLAIVAIHVATLMHPVAPVQVDAATRAAQESERALAALEDRPVAVVVARANMPSVPPLATQVAPDIAPLPPEPAPPPTLTAADFGAITPTPSAREMADWIVSRHDNGKLPFVVLDKHDARLYVFEPDGHALESTPVLLGQSHGDDTYPGIGNVPISQVKPYQRTTAAGRFVTQPGLDEDKTDVVWLDYDAALAMHRVINKVKSEHRLQRLASADPHVRRISWGCINIPIDFFDRRISPVFGKHPGVAYVIPETKTFAQVFEHDGGSAPVVATLTPTNLAPKDVADR
jgi:hypothetical protein